MQLIRSLDPIQPPTPSCITIGAFDGVHRGHQHLISSMVQAAHKARQSAIALTFDPHPGAMLGRRPVATLSTIKERARLLEKMELDALVVLHFTAVIAGTPAPQFITALRQNLGMVELWVGPDFALGHRRTGDIPFLQELGEREGFAVRIIEPLRWRDKIVSSTRIRNALTCGDIEQATNCLGRPYRLGGTVVHGQRLGHSLGIPTANLDPPAGRLIPANGVYACIAYTEQGENWPAVVNVGVRPTVTCDQLTVEAHLIGFEGDLYGQSLNLDFISWLRNEQSFPNLEALVDQIQADIRQAHSLLTP